MSTWARSDKELKKKNRNLFGLLMYMFWGQVCVGAWTGENWRRIRISSCLHFFVVLLCFPEWRYFSICARRGLDLCLYQQIHNSIFLFLISHSWSCQGVQQPVTTRAWWTRIRLLELLFNFRLARTTQHTRAHTLTGDLLESEFIRGA